jgi:hypothetical protein
MSPEAIPIPDANKAVWIMNLQRQVDFLSTRVQEGLNPAKMRELIRSDAIRGNDISYDELRLGVVHRPYSDPYTPCENQEYVLGTKGDMNGKAVFVPIKGRHGKKYFKEAELHRMLKLKNPNIRHHIRSAPHGLAERNGSQVPRLVDEAMKSLVGLKRHLHEHELRLREIKRLCPNRPVLQIA